MCHQRHEARALLHEQPQLEWAHAAVRGASAFHDIDPIGNSTEVLAVILAPAFNLKKKLNCTGTQVTSQVATGPDRTCRS